MEEELDFNMCILDITFIGHISSCAIQLSHKNEKKILFYEKKPTT